MNIVSAAISGREHPDKLDPPRMAFSVQEAAERLGVCQASIYRAIKRRELEAVTLGGRRLIPARSIDRLLSAA